MFRVYTALEKHLAAYHKLLQERAAALQEVRLVCASPCMPQFLHAMCFNL